MSDKIPFAIWYEIFLRLPAESVFRLRDVCKKWRTIIDYPSFVKAHTNNYHLSSSSTTIFLRHSTGPPHCPIYSFDIETLNFTNGPQPITVTPIKLTRSGLTRLHSLPVAACNGLMLIPPTLEWDHKYVWDRRGTLEIWKPLTNERLKVPQPNLSSFVEIVGFGIGYDCVADDYKVVVIDYVSHCGRGSVGQAHVYSLKSDSWRDIGSCPLDFTIGNMEQGVYLNGALHWETGFEIIAFDLATESYFKLAMPWGWSRGVSVKLDALGGFLFMNSYRDARIEVWVMNYNGDQYSWTKVSREFRNGDRSLRAVAYIKDKKQMLFQKSDGFFWLDLESGCVKTIRIHGISTKLGISAQFCGGSLFRLRDSLGNGGSETRTRKRKRKTKMADTKLTFCVTDYCSKIDTTHDSCYNLDSNWFNSSSDSDDS